MKILYCIDMQVDFVTGVLGSEYAKAIVPAVVQKVKEHLESKQPIVFTRDSHFEETYLQSREGKHLPVPHCIIDTEGWQLIPELMELCEQYKDAVIEIEYDGKKGEAQQLIIADKVDRFGFPMFDVTQEMSQMEMMLFSECEFIGVATNMCVISSAIVTQTFKNNSEIIIDATCCASFDPVLHEKALDVMESIHMSVINR